MQMDDTERNSIRHELPRTLQSILSKSTNELRDQDMGLEDFPELMDTVKVTAVTFVEHRSEGNWVECCAHKMYNSRRLLCRPEVPGAKRPDPESERVHDADVEFQPERIVRKLRARPSLPCLF